MKIVMPTVGPSRSAETQDGGKGKREALGQHGQVRLKYRNLGLNLLSSSPESGLIHALVRALPGSEKHCEEPFGGRR
jgi:hypothetical protein